MNNALRCCFALLLLLLAQPAHAQFAFAPGTYELASGSKGTASLKLVLGEGGRPTHLAGVKNGQARSFGPADVRTFTIDSHRFVQVSDFRFRSGTDAETTGPVWLEIVETGPVELFYYHYQVEMGVNFKAHVKLPVLRKAGSRPFLAYCPGHTPGFDQKLAPGGFVAVLFPADPALQRQFAVNAVARLQLPAVVHAYNSGTRLSH